MKKILLFTSGVFLILISANNLFSQTQAFKLGFGNFHYRDTLGGLSNVLHFDIVMQHYNADISGPMEYLSGEYFMNFNTAIANGGSLSYRKIGSELPPAFQPVNASIAGNLLRMAGNFPNPDGPIISTSFPGTLIARMRLTTTASSFAAVPLNLTWRTRGMGGFTTGIFVSIGLLGVEVSENGTYYVDSLNNFRNVNLFNPLYNSIENNSTVNFIWNKVDSAKNYTIEISKDSTMNTNLYIDSLITDTSKLFSGLNLDSKYYWRLRIKDSSGVSYYSYVSNFKTKTFLISPLENAVNQLQDVNFIWKNLSDSVSKYILHISKDSLFNSYLSTDTLISDTSKIKYGFEYNSKYFWKVIANYPSGENDVSAVRNFKTQNASVNLLSPLNNSILNSTSVDFLWALSMFNSAPKYYFKLSTDSLQNEIIKKDSIEGLPIYTVHGLEINKKYYWSVTVKDLYGNNISSVIKNFSTSALNVYLVSPGNNYNDIPVSTALIWRKPVINVSKYKLIVSRDSLQTDIFYSDSTLTDTFKNFTNLDFETKYYWSVRASDTLGNVKTSDLWNFRTATFLYSPGNNSYFLSSILFRWYRIPSALRYKLQIASDPAFENILHSDSTMTDTSKVLTLSSAYTNYYWKVSAKNASGYFRTSEVWTFRKDFPVPVELQSFISEVSQNNITLNWKTSFEINNRGFDIERRMAGGDPLQTGSNEWFKIGNVNGNGTTTSGFNYSFSDRSLATGNYSYRLKQIDFNGNFEYFNLSSDVNVGVPDKFELSQNYPNPFNPSTKINYELPFNSKVSIKLFDVSGREIMTIVNETKTAGYYSVDFNGSSLSSGIYFYSISAQSNGQSFVSTKKMALVK